MKILAVIGSPRKNGNSYRIASQIEQYLIKIGKVDTFDGAKQRPLGRSQKRRSVFNPEHTPGFSPGSRRIDFEYLFLADVKLEMCRGCGLCLNVGDHKCPLKDKDDLAMIERKLLEADGVIFASPVFAMNMTALMKNFMDRFAFTMHRPRFFKQYTLIICVTGAAGLKETISSISALKYCGFNIVNSLGVIIADFTRLSEKTKSKIQKKVSLAANRFYQAIHNKERYSPSLYNLIAFRAQQAVFLLAKKYQPCDYSYFKEREWFDKKKRFYVEANINPFYDWIARAIAGISSRTVSKELADL